MNVRDSEVICGLLTASDYKLTNKPEEADVIIFNTCSVRQHAEERVWSEIGRIDKLRARSYELGESKKKIKVQNPKLQTQPIIGLIGCMAQNYKAEIFKRASAVDFVVGPNDIDKVPKIIDSIINIHNSSKVFEMKIWETEGALRPEEIYHSGFYKDKDHAYVVVSEGCSNLCSYCVVPYVRGRLHNRASADIIREIKEAVKKGITKITLLGQNVNAYPDFAKLLNLVNEINGLKEFTFITSHPKDTSPELFKTMAECGKLKKSLHLPVQSGSDRILKLMNRCYSRDEYLELVKSYRRIIPGGVITTDVIVGFPTETEKDFLDTYNLMKEVCFDAAYIFKYSPRPNTPAEKLTDDVPKEEKEKRHKILLDYQKGLHTERDKNK
ncbi:MAG: MiaB/RimO family radical SAM methylthiotransferase [Candidatus Omnitrophica bacterium]|nr:MiaB/RimO family radical SAM methylthiotransferase [Candidatus Omnitrophota bacterium]